MLTFKLTRNFLPILELHINLFWSQSKPKSNFLSDWVFVDEFGRWIQNHSSETTWQTFFQNISSYIEALRAFIWKSVKSLNQIFWPIGYWKKAVKCHICLRNGKPFLWKSEAIFETFQKFYSEIGFSHNYVENYLEGLNRIF